MNFRIYFLSTIIVILCPYFIVASVSQTSTIAQQYYLSELEYTLIDMDDYLLDYTFNKYSSTCDPSKIDIVASRSDKIIKYVQDNLQTSLEGMIVFANAQSLKINAVALLSNSTIITFVDNASSTSDSSQKLSNLKYFPISNAGKCYSILKASSTSFFIECTSAVNSEGYQVVSLFSYSTSTDFSSSSGIDLSSITPVITTLSFDPLSLFQLSSSAPPQSSNSTYSKRLTSLTQEYIQSQNTQQSEDQYSSFNLHQNTQNGQEESITSKKLLQSSENQLLFLQEYYSCYKDISYYQNPVNNIRNYFRICKYYETYIKTKEDGIIRHFTQSISSFVEYYDLTSSKNGVVKAITLVNTATSDPFLTQGIQQFSDYWLTGLDYEEGFFFYFSFPSKPQQFLRLNQFFSDLDDQKYLNLFLQINQSPEFTIQDVVPNYLVVNTQGYIIYYIIRFNFIDFGFTTFNFEPWPKIVSISHFIDTVRDIHSQNSQQGTQPIQPLQIGNIKEVKFDFDPFLYYISIKYTGSTTTQYLMISRSLTDYTTDINMNPEAIEIDYISSNSYSQMFHYLIQGLFYSNVRSRVRLFEIDLKQISSQNPGMLISIFSWKSSEILKLSTKLFDDQSSCLIEVEFDPKPQSIANGKVDMQIQLQLIPRTFKGIISKNGSNISLVFKNPQPYFSISDWFFGPSLGFTYDFTGSSLNAHINVVSSTSATLNKQDVQAQETSICSDKIVRSMQTTDGYFVFHQSASCSLWFENCQVDSSYYKIKFEVKQVGSQPSACIKSSETQLSQNISSLLFDGEYILISFVQAVDGNDGISHSKAQLLFSKIVTQTSKNLISATYSLTPPSNFDFGGKLLDSIQTFEVFSVPNSYQFGVILQSTDGSSKALKNLVLFEINDKVQGIQIYEFTDDTLLYQGFETSLLDQGLLFATLNSSQNLSSQITVFKVNFLNKKCTTDRVFTSSSLFYQVKYLQASAIKDSKAQESDFVEKGMYFASNPNQFMNDYSLRIWRNNETQTYRMLIVDYGNNCLLDFLLYDLIKPIFLRQVDLFDFKFTQKQSLEITNNILLLTLSKETENYLVPLEINGQQINQIKKSHLLTSSDTGITSQVLSGRGVKYNEGSICQTFNLPIPEIRCVFDPFILLKFDYSATQNTVDGENNKDTSEKKVNFTFVAMSTLSSEVQVKGVDSDSSKNIILQTDFTNFDTNLLTTINTSNLHTYNVKNGVNIRGEQTKTRYLVLDTSFVQGSIEYFSVKIDSGSKQASEQNNVYVQGYIDIAGMKKSGFEISDNLLIDIADKNPYQIVCLSNDGIVVINQNLKFNFTVIYQVKFKDVKFSIKNFSPLSQFNIHIRDEDLTYDQKKGQVLTQQLQFCRKIYSGKVQSSQATSTYLYLLHCDIMIIKTKEIYKQFITFKINVNHFSSLLDQRKEWERVNKNIKCFVQKIIEFKALKYDVKVVDIQFKEDLLDYIIDEIDNFQIMSVTDSLNSIGGYLFFIVRKVKEEEEFFDDSIQGIYKIYVMWEEEDSILQNSDWFYISEINQINSSDLNMSNLVIKNFVASFPSDYPGQQKFNHKVEQNFIFNIGWDDGQRYVIIALFKQQLPPSTRSYENEENSDDKVFSIQFSDIYGAEFSSFIKVSETWRSPLTPLQSTITFNQLNYDVSMIITNQFSIVELTYSLSPIPYLKGENISSDSSNPVKEIIIYTQYAWCENQFNNDLQMQQLLKHQSFFIIQCKSDTSTIYIDANGNQIITNNIVKVYYANDSNSENSSTSGQITQKQYSMVQSIFLEEGQIIKEMSFRSDNKMLFLNLIVGSNDEFLELYQYPVNTIPILIFPADIPDETKIQICASNRYATTPCVNAVFSNVTIDTSDESLRQWLLFGGLIALPLLITVVIIFASIIRLKKMRSKRQTEFIKLLHRQSFSGEKCKNHSSQMENSYYEQDDLIAHEDLNLENQEEVQTSLSKEVIVSSIFGVNSNPNANNANVTTQIK